jgi:hypothetical protein
MIIKRNILMTEKTAKKSMQAWNTNAEVPRFLKLQDRCFCTSVGQVTEEMIEQNLEHHY